MVYPRACGGTGRREAATFPLPGLSPRLRGNLRNPNGEIMGLGSIPAPAGEPTLAASTSCWLKVYPRACGGTAYCPLLDAAF